MGNNFNQNLSKFYQKKLKKFSLKKIIVVKSGVRNVGWEKSGVVKVWSGKSPGEEYPYGKCPAGKIPRTGMCASH